MQPFTDPEVTRAINSLRHEIQALKERLGPLEEYVHNNPGKTPTREKEKQKTGNILDAKPITG